MDATLSRYAFMETLPQAFGGITESIVVGGSMGYGPFYSVRQGMDHGDPSDVDALFILDEDYLEDDKIAAFLSAPDLTDTDKAEFIDRLHKFSAARKQNEVDIISQRFDVPGRNFNMSAHFFPLDVFEAMNGSGLENDMKRGEDTVLAIRDYKPRRFEHTACNQQSFDGSVYNYVVPDHKKADQGYVVEIPGYIINGQRLYPGLYQNVISPEFSVYFDRGGQTTEIVERFKNTVIQSIQRERATNQIASLALSHIRHQVFSPGRYDQRPALAA